MSHNYLNKNRTQELINTIRGHLSDIATVLSNLASGDARDNTKAPINHNQASSTITAMTGYSKPQSTSAITATDTLNEAIGKLEKGLDGAGGGLQPGNVDLSTDSVILSPTTTSATVTLSNATGDCIIIVDGTACTARLNDNIITIDRSGNTGGLANIIILVTSNGFYSAAIKIISVVSLATWALASDEMIEYMIQAHRDGLIDLTDYWEVNDVRTVNNLDRSVITAQALNLILCPGASYVDENGITKESVFGVLVDQKRTASQSSILSWVNVDGNTRRFTFNFDTSIIESCLSNHLTKMLLSQRYLYQYTMGIDLYTYKYSKYLQGGTWLAKTTQIPVASSKYYASDTYRIAGHNTCAYFYAKDSATTLYGIPYSPGSTSSTINLISKMLI